MRSIFLAAIPNHANLFSWEFEPHSLFLRGDDLQLLTEEDEMLVNIYRNSARGSSNNVSSNAQEFTRASGNMPVKIDLKKDASSPRKVEYEEVERSVWQLNVPKNQSSEEKMIKPLQFTTRDLLKPQ